MPLKARRPVGLLPVRLVQPATPVLPCRAVSTKPVYVTSDAHLGAVSPEGERAFLAWLEHAGSAASRIVINGDLFDFWFEYRSAIPRGYTRALGALARIVDDGVPVLLMGGNHDWWGGSYLRDEVGVDFHQEPVVVDLAGHRTYLAHGDGLGRGDLGYRLLRWMLRSRVTRTAFRWLHPDVGAWIARSVSVTPASAPPERSGEPSEAERARARILGDWARTKLRSEPDLDLVLLGHAHVPEVDEVDAGRFYVNTGDWIHHRSYAVLEPDTPPRLERWSP